MPWRSNPCNENGGRAPRPGEYKLVRCPRRRGSGTFGTIACSINTASTISGVYSDTNGALHGFVRTAQGVITTFDAPGAGGTGFLQGTGGFGINTKGVIAGTYSDASNAFHGFLRTPK